MLMRWQNFKKKISMAVWIGAKAVVESIFGQMLAGKLLVKLSKRSLGLMPRKPTDQQKKKSSPYYKKHSKEIFTYHTLF